MENVKCSICEEYKSIDNFNNDKTAPTSRYNKHYWCKVCFLTRQKKQSYHINTESRFITRLVSTCKVTAKHRGKKDLERGEFSIDRETILRLKEKQNNKCAISNVELIWKHNCKKGYTEDNIRLVTQQVNYALSNFEYEWFLDMCKNVVIYNKLL